MREIGTAYIHSSAHVVLGTIVSLEVALGHKHLLTEVTLVRDLLMEDVVCSQVGPPPEHASTIFALKFGHSLPLLVVVGVGVVYGCK